MGFVAGGLILTWAVFFGRAFRHVMVVVGEKPLEKEHHQEPAQGPAHGLID